MPQDLRTVYIVGGSSGIGLAFARRMGQRKARVALFARGTALLREAELQVQAAGATEVTHQALDITDDATCGNRLREVAERFGAPDLLVNCAGQARPGEFEQIDAKRFDTTLKVNVYGTYNVIRALLPLMKERGGHIVNVSSVAGLIGVYGFTDYCAAKFAVIGFSEALRQEVARHRIHVSVLCPPDTDTPGLAKENETKPEPTKALSGKARLLSPDAVADALLRGIERKKFLIIPGFDGKMSYLAKRLVPGVVSRVMQRTIRSIEGRG